MRIAYVRTTDVQNGRVSVDQFVQVENTGYIGKLLQISNSPTNQRLCYIEGLEHPVAPELLKIVDETKVEPDVGYIWQSKSRAFWYLKLPNSTLRFNTRTQAENFKFDYFKEEIQK